MPKQPRRYAIGDEQLEQAIAGGLLRAVRLSDFVAVEELGVAVLTAQISASAQGDELVSVNKAARRLNVNPGTVWRWHIHGWLPLAEYGRRRAILVSLTRANALADLRGSSRPTGSPLSAARENG